ncbi:3-oxoacyl-[acyl-carrier-protein] synthase III C-terminal domain-containing protein [Streptomyces sp. NPDC058486]|uniref:3-oxoacyl-[acyl-carrier-protein] synthase III C-terminal domain-containing protein n=1 Tax=unclassified Streptomyces TaxID=2593676 RepID=UPI003646E9B7
MSIRLSAVATRLPQHVEPVADFLVRQGLSPRERRVFDRVYSLRETRVLEDGESFEELLLDAGAEALRGERADLVLYGHTLLSQPMAYGTGFAGRVRRRLGTPGTPVFGVSQVACTSVLHSIDLAARYLTRTDGPERRVLVLGGDQGSVSDGPRFIPGVTVAGDGAAAVVVRRGHGRYALLASARDKDTRFHQNLRLDEESAPLYGAATAEGAVRVVRAAVARAGLSLEDIDWVLPHHNNAMFWRSFSSMTGVPRSRIVLDLLPRYGHTFGIDGLLGVAHLDRAARLRPGERCVLVALGQGAYFSALVIESKGQPC